MNRLTGVRTCGLGSTTKATFLHPGAVCRYAVEKFHAAFFHVIIFLDQAGMSVFTAIVGIRLSYRDHSRHGNQGWCTVLSRPLHILEHWELVWKFSSLKIKTPFMLSTFSNSRAVFVCFVLTATHNITVSNSFLQVIYIFALFLLVHFWYLSTDCSRKAKLGFKTYSLKLALIRKKES